MGHSNTKCASFSTTLLEQKWRSLVSLEIGVIIHHPISMHKLGLPDPLDSVFASSIVTSHARRVEDPLTYNSNCSSPKDSRLEFLKWSTKWLHNGSIECNRYT